MLVASASVISSAGYFLWRIARFPDLDSADALLIGFTVACAVFLGVWGIISGRGNAVESSLLFAYVVLCIYQIFTDYQPSYPLMAPQHAASPSDIPPLPPIIMASYSTLIYALSTLPGILHSAFNFMIAALYTITPSVIISLAYRIFVLFASTRIIPAVRESGARSLEQEPSLDDRDGAGRILGLLSWFTPSILISVYTSLLMQHFASTVSAEAGGGWWTSQAGGIEGGKVWRWVNVVGTMLMYAIELKLSEQDYDGGLTGHWKSD